MKNLELGGGWGMEARQWAEKAKRLKVFLVVDLTLTHKKPKCKSGSHAIHAKAISNEIKIKDITKIYC